MIRRRFDVASPCAPLCCSNHANPGPCALRRNHILNPIAIDVVNQDVGASTQGRLSFGRGKGHGMEFP